MAIRVFLAVAELTTYGSRRPPASARRALCASEPSSSRLGAAAQQWSLTKTRWFPFGRPGGPSPRRCQCPRRQRLRRQRLRWRARRSTTTPVQQVRPRLHQGRRGLQHPRRQQGHPRRQYPRRLGLGRPMRARRARALAALRRPRRAGRAAPQPPKRRRSLRAPTRCEGTGEVTLFCISVLSPHLPARPSGQGGITRV